MGNINYRPGKIVTRKVRTVTTRTEIVEMEEPFLSYDIQKKGTFSAEIPFTDEIHRGVGFLGVGVEEEIKTNTPGIVERLQLAYAALFSPSKKGGLDETTLDEIKEAENEFNKKREEYLKQIALIIEEPTETKEDYGTTKELQF